MKYLILAALAAMTSAGSAQAAATLSCAVVGTRQDTSCSSATSNYIAGPKFAQKYFASNLLSFNFTGSDLVITNVFNRAFVSSSSSGTTILAFTSGSDPFTAATLTDSGPFFNNPKVSLSGNTLSVDITDVFWTDAGTATVQLYNATVAAVPEPATWAMMIAGFGMIGGAMRRRGRVTAAVRFA